MKYFLAAVAVHFASCIAMQAENFTSEYAARSGSSASVTGTTNVPHGGTGVATLTGIPYGTGTGAFGTITIGSNLTLSTGTLSSGTGTFGSNAYNSTAFVSSISGTNGASASGTGSIIISAPLPTLAINPASWGTYSSGSTFTNDGGRMRFADSANNKVVVPLSPSYWAGKTVTMSAVVSTTTNSSGNVAYRMWIGYSTSAVDGTATYNFTGNTTSPDTTVRTFADSTTAYYATIVALPSSVAIPSNATQCCAYFEMRRTDGSDTSTANSNLEELRVSLVP